MITVTNYGPVRELRLNRPPVNALSTELISALRKAIEQAPVDGARAVLVSGPPDMFSAGLDIPLLFKCNRDEMVQLWRELYGLMKALASSSIPICAAITGHAPAGGTVIALFCDWRVAAQGDFRLGLSEVQVGIPLPPVILGALRRQVGARKAEHLAVAGLILSPEQSLSVGLVENWPLRTRSSNAHWLGAGTCWHFLRRRCWQRGDAQEPIWSGCLTKAARKSCARYWTAGGARRHKACCTRWL